MTASFTTLPLRFCEDTIGRCNWTRHRTGGNINEAVQDGGYQIVISRIWPYHPRCDACYEGIKFGVYGFLSNYYGEKNNKTVP